MENPCPKDITFKSAHDMMESHAAIVFDVREPEEFVISHALGAINFPLDDITNESAKKAVPSLKTPIIVYCKSGNRAGQAAQKLCSFGYENVYNLKSLVDWPYELGFGDFD